MQIPSFESPLKPLSYDILITTRAAKMRPPQPNLSQLVTMCDRWLIACQSGQYDHILITHTCFPCYKLNTSPNDMVVGSNWSPSLWPSSYMSHSPYLTAKYVRIPKMCMFYGVVICFNHKCLIDITRTTIAIDFKSFAQADTSLSLSN